MSPPPLTAAQAEAVTAPRHVAVTAAAGSGKTRVLVERLLWLLLQDASRRPGDLLAITFTNRAAAEMRARLHRRLLALAEAGEAPAETREQARACLDQFHTAAVMTIHAFAVEVLRAHPFEAGIDPGFTVADEIRAGHARFDVVAALMQEITWLPGEHALRPSLATVLRALGHGRTARALLSLLSREGVATATWAMLAERSPEQVLGASRSAWEADQRSVIEAATSGGARELLQRGAALLAAEEGEDVPLARWAPSSATLLDSAAPLSQRVAALGALLGLVLTDKSEPRRRLPAPSAHLAAGTKRELGEIIPALGERWRALRAELIPWDDAHERQAADLALALTRLVHQARLALAARKDAEGWLDFGDQLRLAASLVEREPGQVAAALARRFRGVLIDEFQDTDPSQWRLVEALLRAAAPGELPVMLVGDPRQSIYRFRGADVALTEIAAQALAGHGGDAGFRRVSLRENFRSTPPLVAAVSGVFGDLFPRVSRGTAAPMPEPDVTSSSPLAPWPASVHLVPVPQGPGHPPAVEVEAASVAALMGAMIRRPAAWAREVWGCEPPDGFAPRPRDFALLFRATTHLDAFERALRREGIPFNVGGGAGLMRRPEIWDLAHLMRWLCDPQDDVALLGLLRTPWIGWSDDLLFKVTLLTCGLAPRDPPPLWERVRHVRRAERHGVSLTEAEWRLVLRAREWLSHAHRRSLHAAPAEAVDTLLTTAGAWGLVRLEGEGRRRLANLRRGLQRIRTLGGTGFDSVAAAAEALERLVDQGGRIGEEQLTLMGDDAASLLTIHAAKGLEFPIVILPQLDARLTLQESRHDILWTDAHGLGVRAASPADAWKPLPSVAMRLGLRQERREQLAEEARLLYVAMTRAQRMLVLCGGVRPQPADGDTPMRWILRALTPGDELSASGRVTPRWPGAEPIPVLTPERCQAMTGAGSTAEAPPALPQPGALDPALLQPPRVDIDEDRFVAITALEVFARCPNWHFLEHEAGRPQAAWFRRPEVPHIAPVDPAAVGSLFHRRVECHFGPSPTAWAIGADAEARARVEALWPAFEAMPVFARIAAAAERLVEHDIVVALPSGLLRGRVDLLLREGASWEVIDFKTGTPAEDDESIRARHRLQMLCYLLALRVRAPEQGVWSARLVYPAEGREVVVALREADAAQALGEIDALVRRFKRERGRLHPVYPNAACPPCPFERLPICRRLARA